MLNNFVESGYWYICPDNKRYAHAIGLEKNGRTLQFELNDGLRIKDWTRPSFDFSKSNRIPDWMFYVGEVAVSKRLAKFFLNLHNIVQLLPSENVLGNEYYFLNVICAIGGADEYEYSAPSFLIDGRYVETKPFKPKIFRTEGPLGKIYLSGEFANEIVKNKMTGAVFVDPRVDEMSIIFLDKSLRNGPYITK